MAKKKRSDEGGALTLKSLTKPATIKRHAKVAMQALIWVGLGYWAGRYLPSLIISRVTFLREQAAKSEKHDALVRAGLGILVLGPGAVILASKVGKTGAQKALKYVLGGVALGAAQPLLVPYFASGAQKLDELLPAPDMAVPAGYLGDGVSRAQVFQLPAPGGDYFAPPSTTAGLVKRARIAA